MTKLTLSELKNGQVGKISKVRGGGGVRRRLLDMGMVTGSEVEVLRVAPFGDPVEIKVKGYNLTLRRTEAADIEVEVT